MALSKQMEMFEEGGLKEQGGTVDEESGNEVPIGSTKEEVRDDIPAKLSEGEFVFPADVVRYIGLEKLMRLRQEAKQGLKQMEAMGQMGNSDEATMPDDLPFDETDLDIEDDLEYNTGGVIEGQQEVYAPGNFDTLATAPEGPKVQNVRYYSEQLKQVRFIPHLLNPDGSLGNTIYPVPKGFVPQEEPVEEPVEKEKQKSGTQEQGDNEPSEDDKITSELGGARTTIGDVDYAVQYNPDGTVGLQSIDNFKATGQRNFQVASAKVAEAIKTQTIGQLGQIAKARGLGAVAVAEIGKQMGIDTPRYDKLNEKIDKAKEATTFLKNIKQRDVFKEMPSVPFAEPAVAKVEDLNRAQVKSLQSAIETGKGTDAFTAKEAADIAEKAEQDRTKAEKEQAQNLKEPLSFGEKIRAAKRRGRNRKAQEKAEREGRITGREAGMSMGGSDDPGDSGFSVSDQGYDTTTGFGTDISTAVGGLIPKKKKKTKKMKQGGLASKN